MRTSNASNMRTLKTTKLSDRVSELAGNILVRKSPNAKLSGFTLAELVIVVAILAVLATVGLVALSGYSQDAKDSAVKSNVRSLYAAISSEAASTGNSPRYYVVHDSGATLSGAVAYVDGTPSVLTGGTWNAPGTNYSAGEPDFSKLKLDPTKFRVSSAPERGTWSSVRAEAE